MSIAVSAVIAPSRVLKGLRVSMAIGALAIAAMLLAGLEGDMPWIRRLFLSIFPVVAAIILALPSCKKIGSYRIDISGQGQIRRTPIDANAGCQGSDGTDMTVQVAPSALFAGTLISMR